jgi:hypothetical protein
MQQLALDQSASSAMTYVFNLPPSWISHGSILTSSGGVSPVRLISINISLSERCHQTIKEAGR